MFPTSVISIIGYGMGKFADDLSCGIKCVDWAGSNKIYSPRHYIYFSLRNVLKVIKKTGQAPTRGCDDHQLSGRLAIEYAGAHRQDELQVRNGPTSSLHIGHLLLENIQAPIPARSL